jgi:hypothetical protein
MRGLPMRILGFLILATIVLATGFGAMGPAVPGF